METVSKSPPSSLDEGIPISWINHDGPPLTEEQLNHFKYQSTRMPHDYDPFVVAYNEDHQLQIVAHFKDGIKILHDPSDKAKRLAELKWEL